MQVRKDSYNAEAVVGFLKVLLRKMSGKILIIWDGSPIHRNKEIKAFLKTKMGKRLHLEQLPGYAPDLNPDEGMRELSQARRDGQSLLPGSRPPVSAAYSG